MPADFTKALAFVLKREGGWHPGNLRTDPQWTLEGERRDPYPTMKGVRQDRYDAYRRELGLPTQSVKLISDEELAGIYKKWYWNPVVKDIHTDSLALIVFDTSVNFGPGIPQLWLKLTEDPRCFLLLREAVYRWMAKTTSRGKKNIAGWLNRINALYKAAGIEREKPYAGV